jgi:hypothetical protein
MFLGGVHFCSYDGKNIAGSWGRSVILNKIHGHDIRAIRPMVASNILDRLLGSTKS